MTNGEQLIKEYKDKEKSKYIRSNFITFFDGCYEVDPEPNTPTTYSMGLCSLEYDNSTNILTVYLRLPGMLIGKGGELLDRVIKRLDCNLNIIEVNLMK